MMWDTVSEESYEVYECASLISNNFTLNSGGRSIAERRAESHSRSVQHRLNIAPLSLNYDDVEDGVSTCKDPTSIEDVSFYENSPQNSPRPCPVSPCIDDDDVGLLSPEGSPQRISVVQNTVTMVEKRRSLEEIDSNSVDSGYGMSSFKFAEPKLPKKSSSLSISPTFSLLRKHHDIMQLQHHHDGHEEKTPPKNFRIFHSLSSGSMESMDDDYMDLFEMEALEEDVQLPSNLNSLISGDIKTIKTTPEMKRPVVRRCLSLTDSSMNRVRSTLFEPKTPEILKPVQENLNTTPYSSLRQNERCFKRPEPPTTASPIQSKRPKCDLDEKENAMVNANFNYSPVIQRPVLKKAISMNDALIKHALARSSSEPALIGDFSKPFCLPLMEGRHRDLKSISCETMAKLLRGEYNDNVASFKIIDCRYPYEYDGGHIRGAQNLYTHDQILDELVNCKTDAPTVQAVGPKRHILVFHCEFSSERGPKLSRFLRNHDRLRNTNAYPALHYPEIYLLHGGYKDFYENYPGLCDPVAYRPMLHPSYGAAYRQFRAKSKSWNGENKVAVATNRSLKSRSRLVL